LPSRGDDEEGHPRSEERFSPKEWGGFSGRTPRRNTREARQDRRYKLDKYVYFNSSR
jgi:hypothetical protein